MNSTSLIFTLGLGFMLGLRHATEADHVVAVATIVSERRSVLASAVVGMYWGIGHTLSLLVAMLVVLALGTAIPEDIAGLLEFAVAVMIIGLGCGCSGSALALRPGPCICPTPARGGRCPCATASSRC